MTWFFAVLIVLLLGAVAVIASGRAGTIAEVYDDRPDARVPAGRPLTGDDVRRVRFTTALRGYRMSEVDALLERLADQLDQPPRDQPPRDAPPRDPADPPGPTNPRPGR